MSEVVFINKTYKMNHFANCNTSFLVYHLECPCGFFYASWTKSRFKNLNYAMAVHYFWTSDSSSRPSKCCGPQYAKRTD